MLLLGIFMRGCFKKINGEGLKERFLSFFRVYEYNNTVINEIIVK